MFVRVTLLVLMLTGAQWISLSEDAFASSPAVTLSVNNNSEIPVRISDIRVVVVGTAKELLYTLTNLGKSRLSAYSIEWQTRFSDNTVSRSESTGDYLFDAEEIAPNSSEALEIGVMSVKDHPEIRVVSMTGTIKFAEFADGLRLGDDQAKVSGWLSQQRTRYMAEYERLLQVYRVGGDAALKDALAKPDQNEEPFSKSVRVQLVSMEAEKGINAVVAELNRLDALTARK